MHPERTILEPDALRYDEGSGTVVLWGSECTRCGRRFFPPRRRCAACAEETVRPRELSTQGLIGSFTQLHRTPREAWVTAPYVMAEVQLPEGLVVYGLITGGDWDDLQIGMPVQLVPLPVSSPNGEEVLAYGFAPVSNGGGKPE